MSPQPQDPASLALDALENSGLAFALRSLRVFDGSGWSILLEEVPTVAPSEFPRRVEERVPDLLAECAPSQNLSLKALFEFKKGAQNAIWYFLKRRTNIPDFSSPHIRTNAGDVRETEGVVMGVGWLNFPLLGLVHGQPQAIFDKVAVTPRGNKDDLYKARRQLAIGERAVVADEFTSLVSRKRANTLVPELTYFVSVLVTEAELKTVETEWRRDGSLGVRVVHDVNHLVFQSTRPIQASYQPLSFIPIVQRETFLRQYIFIVNSNALAAFLRDAETVSI